MLIVCALVVAAIALLGLQRKRAWEKFVASHNCNVVAHHKGDVDIAVGTAIGIGPNASPQISVAVVPVIQDDKDAWKCDDGRTYWR